MGRSVLPVDLLAEPAKSTGETRLHGAARDPQGLGGLDFRQFEEIARSDDLTVLVAKRIDRGQQHFPRLAGEDRRLGRWSRIVRAAVLGSPKDEPGSAASRPPAVAGLVRDDPQEPWPKGRIDPETGECRVGLHEGFLGGIFRVAVGRDDVRGPDGHVLVPADQFLVGHDLAFARAFDQFSFFQWTALHGQPYFLHRGRRGRSRLNDDRRGSSQRATRLATPARPYNPAVTDPLAPLPGRVFRRSSDPDLPVAVEAHGATIIDSKGREYIDAAGGAVVVNVGHGRASVAKVLAEQAARISYAHGSAFTTKPLEVYAREVGRHLPVDGPAIYPVSGGSEAVETALKLARAYHLARGESDRWTVFGRWGSYHGNTLGALDLSGRPPLRRPYEGWLGRFRHVSAAYPYRAGEADAHALGDPEELAAELDRAFEAAGSGTVAAFVAEPIVGATLAAAVPPDGYWPRIAEACRRHGVLLVADEVMTGFGRTGRWFGLDHWGVRPDLLVAAKGASSGYWPFGFVAVSDEVHRTVGKGGGFVHGFTYSHAPAGAAVAREVLRILESEELVEASRVKGERLAGLLSARLGNHPNVGEIRGRGLLIGLELVADRSSRRPFPRTTRLTESVVGAARRAGVLVYSATGNANGVDGDLILLGPPFVISEDEMAKVVGILGDAIETCTASAARSDSLATAAPPILRST